MATLLFASSNAAVCAFTAFSASGTTNTRSSPTVKSFLPHTSTSLYTVADSKTDPEIIKDLESKVKEVEKETKNDTDTPVGDIEEKAWKIIKEHTEEGDESDQVSAKLASDASPAETEKTSTETSVETSVEIEVEKAVEAPAEKAAEKSVETVVKPTKNAAILDENDLVSAIEEEAMNLVEEMASDFDEECEVDEEGNAVDELCVDESKLSRAKNKLKNIVGRTLGLVRTGGGDDLAETGTVSTEFQIIDFEDGDIPEGELLEMGWEKRGNSNALRRNAEVWKFALSCVFKALKPRKMRKKGATEEEIQEAKTEAATFIRNGLLKLGPSFVKLVCCLRNFHTLFYLIV